MLKDLCVFNPFWPCAHLPIVEIWIPLPYIGENLAFKWSVAMLKVDSSIWWLRHCSLRVGSSADSSILTNMGLQLNLNWLAIRFGKNWGLKRRKGMIGASYPFYFLYWGSPTNQNFHPLLLITSLGNLKHLVMCQNLPSLWCKIMPFFIGMPELLVLSLFWLVVKLAPFFTP